MSTTPHILVVEDDAPISALVARYLRANDCRVSVAGDGREMNRVLADAKVDLVVLDLMLPDTDGLTLCRKLRGHSNLPVIMLTAKGEEVDRILGLEMGADDYLVKPFNPRELLARIRAVLRRGAMAAPAGLPRGSLRFDGWQIDPARRTLADPNGTRVALTGAEFDLLLVFCERSGRVLSREQLIDLTKGREALPFERSIDILVSRLRRKMEKNTQEPELIKTVRSGGYVFTPEVAPA